MPPPALSTAHPRTAVRAALFLVLVGMCAALHIWKVPPALPQLQTAFGLSLVESGFLLSAVQLGGLILGLPIALVAERIGLRRCVLAGLLILALASALGAWLNASLLVLLCRAAEGCGVLMVAMPIPALIRRLVPPEQLSRIMGLWGSYMPLGTVIILLAGSWILRLGDWRLLWALLSGLTLCCLLLTLRLVPADPAADPDRPRESAPRPAGRQIADGIGARHDRSQQTGGGAADALGGINRRQKADDRHPLARVQAEDQRDQPDVQRTQRRACQPQR